MMEAIDGVKRIVGTVDNLGNLVWELKQISPRPGRWVEYVFISLTFEL
jgi:hypothetical protein